MTTSVKDQSASVQQRELTRSGHEEHLLLPDLFISFMAPEPRLNPRYEEVKQVSESWIAEYVMVKNQTIESWANGSDPDYAITMRKATKSMLQQTFRTWWQFRRGMLNLKSFEPSVTG